MSMPNVDELKERIGGTGLLRVDGSLRMAVVIVDVRVRFGHVDYCVASMADENDGLTWIESGRFIPDDKPNKPGEASDECSQDAG